MENDKEFYDRIREKTKAEQKAQAKPDIDTRFNRPKIQADINDLRKEKA